MSGGSAGGRPVPGRGWGTRAPSALAVLALAAALVGFAALPLAALAVDSVSAGGRLDFSAWTGALAEPRDREALLHTAWLVLGVWGFTLAVGVPLGFLVGRTDLPGRGAWKALCAAPWAIPPYVLGIAWIQLLSPTAGWLNAPLVSAGFPALDIYTLPGMVWVLGLSFTPFVLLQTADALARMDASVEEAARMAGASPGRVLLTITLPMALPAVLSSSALVLAATSAAFGVPYLLASGTAEPATVLTTRIFYALAADPEGGRAKAAGLAGVLAVVGIALPLALQRIGKGRSFATVTGKAGRGEPFRLGRARPLALAAAAGYVGIAVVLPVGVIAVTSVLRNIGGGLTPGNLTLDRWVEVLAGRDDTREALWHSAILAAGAATAATAVGGAVAWLRARSALPFRRALAGLATLPYSVPGTVLALGYLLCFSREVRLVLLDRITFVLALSDTLWMLGIAYAVKEIAFPVRGVAAGIQALHPSLEEAARLSGAGPARAAVTVTAPLLRPVLASAWLLVFLPCFSEVTMSILLSGPRTRVVGTVLFDLQSYGDPPAAAVLAMVVVVLVAAGSLGAGALARRFGGAGAGP